MIICYVRLHVSSLTSYMLHKATSRKRLQDTTGYTERFRSRGPCENVPRPFVSDTSLKRIDREGLGKRRTGTRQQVTHASSKMLRNLGNIWIWMGKKRMCLTYECKKV